MPADSPGGGLVVAEPGGRYARRQPLVVDCSVLAAVLFDESTRDEAAAILTGRELYAPDLLDHEMVSVALNKADTADAAQALADLAELRMTRCPVDPGAQFELARRHELTAYDAAYLQLAIDLGAPLATFDQALGKAAQEILAAP